MHLNSYIFSHPSCEGQFVRVGSDCVERLSLNESGDAGIKVEVDTKFDLSPGSITSASLSSRKDFLGVAVGYDDGRVCFPMQTSAPEISLSNRVNAMAWNPIYDHQLAVSAGESLVLADVAQVYHPKPFTDDNENEFYMSVINPMFRGVSDMRWIPAMPTSLVVASPSKSNPMIFDIRSQTGPSILGVEDQRSRNATVTAVAAHPSQPYVATGMKDRSRNCVLFWDIRNPSTAISRQNCEEVGYMDFSPSDMRLVVASKGTSGLRIMKFDPQEAPEGDDGYSTVYSAASTESSMEAQRNARLPDRNRIETEEPLAHFAWVRSTSSAPQMPPAILGLSHTGQVRPVALRTTPKFDWVGPTEVMVTFGGSLARVDPVGSDVRNRYLDDSSYRIEQRLKRGFGVDPAKNATVAAECGDHALNSLFTYVSFLRQLKAPFAKPFPGIVNLLASDYNAPTNGAAFPGPVENIPPQLAPNRALILQALGVLSSNTPECDDEAEFERIAGNKIFFGQISSAIDILNTMSRRRMGAHDGVGYVSLSMLLQELVRKREPISWSRESVEILCNGLRTETLEIALHFLETHWPSLELDDTSDFLKDQRIPHDIRIGVAVMFVKSDTALMRLLRGWKENLQTDVGLAKVMPALFLLTGITEDSAELMQEYVDLTGDVQVAASLFALQPACKGFFEWNRAYRDVLNSWGLYIQRAQFDLAFRKLQKALDDTRATSSLAAAPKQAKLPVEVHCQCGQALHDSAPLKHTLVNRAQQQSKMSCPNPKCSYHDSGFPKCAVCGGKMEPRELCTSREQWFVWCTRCLHGGHKKCIDAWFAKHSKCPIEECQCHCQHADSFSGKR